MKTTKAVTAVLAGSLAFALIAGACGSSKSNTAATTAAGETSSSAAIDTTAATTPATTAVPTPDLKATLNSSGSTFAKVYMEEAIADFTATNSGVTINYGAGGSGKGRQDLADQVTDFAASDSPIPAADMGKFKGGDVLYFPIVVAPITLSYNLGVDKLQLSPDTIAKIFQRQIKKWNDAAIAADNPGVTLPSTDIVVAHRSDSSGTTDNFTKFLDRAAGASGSGAWTLKSGSTVEWPTDTQAGNGNAGVAQIIQGTTGAIGYVDLADAKSLDLKFAAVKNKAGKFVEPTLDGASAAAAGTTVNPDLTFSAPWADGDGAYPITAQAFILVYKKQTDKDKGLATEAFIRYLLGDGQQITTDLNYGPVPADLVTKEIAQLDSIELPA
ncbi:MAG: phosphate ABC transporter substrate-binding protein PstS [Acidimicrobiales bacterium]